MEQDIKNLTEIIELSKEEIENNNENVTAILDLEDLKSLKNILDNYNLIKISKEETEELLENRINQLEDTIMEQDLELIGKEEYVKAAMGEIIEQYYTANEDCISKKQIQDKIDELNKQEKELQSDISEEEREEYSDANIAFSLMHIEIQREVLEELLKGE